MADLALAHQRGQRFELLADRRLGRFLGRVVVERAERRHMAFGPVDLVEVDGIGAQPAQAGLA